MYNWDICKKVGLENFMIEVVTDNALELPTQSFVREIVVPSDYKTKSGALYKARALQYCLEDEVNILNNNDWVVHLDEETVLTESAVKGVFNFVHDGQHHFGQGVITYTNLGIENLLITLADSIRVAIDHGTLRFQFTYLHQPIFNWKGSFVVANAAAEKEVTWDHGPEGSIAEDCFFGMVAMSKGFTFGFIQGEMWESSPFNIKDYIKQRRRWLTGITMTFWSRKLPLRCKFGLFFMVWAWTLLPVTTTNILIQFLFPMPWLLYDVVSGVMAGTFYYLFMLGAAKSFSPVRIGWLRYFSMILLSLVSMLIVIVGENMAAILVIFGKRPKFEIVNKDPNKASKKIQPQQDLIQLETV